MPAGHRQTRWADGHLGNRTKSEKEKLRAGTGISVPSLISWPERCVEKGAEGQNAKAASSAGDAYMDTAQSLNCVVTSDVLCF